MNDDERAKVLGQRALHQEKAGEIAEWLKKAAQDLANIAKAMDAMTTMELSVRHREPAIAAATSDGPGAFLLRRNQGAGRNARLADSQSTAKMVSFEDINDALERLREHDGKFFEYQSILRGTD